MRRTSTVIFSLSAFCVAGIVMAQDEFSPGELPRPADMEPFDQPAPTIERSYNREFDETLGLGIGRISGLLPGSYRQDAGFINVETKLRRSITEAMNKLGSEDADERRRAKSQLEIAFSEIFEQRAKMRLKQIEELEQRIAKLRDQMERREEKKSEIIQLQVQTYINQANGLGF